MELGIAWINLLYCNPPFLITDTPSLFIESSTSLLPTLACHEDLERKKKKGGGNTLYAGHGEQSDVTKTQRTSVRRSPKHQA